MNDPTKLKMYILVKASLPSHKSVAVAHGVLMCYLKFTYKSDEFSYRDGKFEQYMLSDNARYMSLWENHSFRKVVCEVSDVDFLKAAMLVDMGSYVVVTESSLNNQEVALAFCPRWEWPKEFGFFPLAKW